MLNWLKQRLTDWVEQHQRREIVRLQQVANRLKAELELQTGRPIQLTPEVRRQLARKAQGIDPEILKQISVFDPDDLKMPSPKSDSADNA